METPLYLVVPQSASLDNTFISSEEGAAGSKVSVQSQFFSRSDHTHKHQQAAFNSASNSTGNADETTEFNASFAVKAAAGGEPIWQDISVGVITQENISFLRSQMEVRPYFQPNSISTQKTNMRAALPSGRCGFGEETTNTNTLK